MAKKKRVLFESLKVLSKSEMISARRLIVLMLLNKLNIKKPKSPIEKFLAERYRAIECKLDAAIVTLEHSILLQGRYYFCITRDPLFKMVRKNLHLPKKFRKLDHKIFKQIKGHAYDVGLFKCIDNSKRTHSFELLNPTLLSLLTEMYESKTSEVIDRQRLEVQMFIANSGPNSSAAAALPAKNEDGRGENEVISSPDTKEDRVSKLPRSGLRPPVVEPKAKQSDSIYDISDEELLKMAEAIESQPGYRRYYNRFKRLCRNQKIDLQNLITRSQLPPFGIDHSDLTENELIKCIGIYEDLVADLDADGIPYERKSVFQNAINGYRSFRTAMKIKPTN